jgi:hypothetical protein
VIEAVLQSPSFLFRIEVGEPLPDRPLVSKLTSFELASRLSFLLHGAPPDDVLLDAAAAGRFDTADGIEEAAREMLEAPETIANLMNFAEQWLRLTELEDVAVDPTQAPQGGGDLRESMRLSVLALVEEVIVDGHGVDLLLTAGHVHADAAIAQLYGVTPPDQEWDATAVDENERAGLLTAPAILAMTSPTEKSEPIIRGKWMRDVLLCSSPPPPPPDVPELPSDDDVTSVRDALSQHRDDPACSGCHEFLDPLGFGLERYDALGRLREQDSFGADLSGRGTIVGLGEPIDFQGARELAEQIVALPAFDKCLTEHAFRFAMGRLPEMAETCAVEHVIDGYGAAGRDFRELIVALVRSDAFRYVQTPQQGS